MTRRILLALSAAASMATAWAQMPAAGSYGACQQPEVRRAWEKPHRLAESLPNRQAATPTPGQTQQPYRVTLQPCASDACKSGTHAALVRVDVAQAGRYRVAVDQMVWIDVLDATRKLDGLMCEHSGCAPVRKIMQYALAAGPHWLAFEGKAPGELGFVVTAVPD